MQTKNLKNGVSGGLSNVISITVMSSTWENIPLLIADSQLSNNFMNTKRKIFQQKLKNTIFSTPFLFLDGYSKFMIYEYFKRDTIQSKLISGSLSGSFSTILELIRNMSSKEKLLPNRFNFYVHSKIIL
jgi:hypothetical protein